MSAQTADGIVPFEIRLKCPDRPGTYAVQANMTLVPSFSNQPKGDSKPVQDTLVEILIESPRVQIEVKKP